MRSALKVFLLLGAFVIIGGITGYLTLRFIVKSEDAVIVPDLVGKEVVYALELLTDLGLNTKVSGYEYRTDVPKDSVARQDPGAGTEVKKDRDIRIVISKGPETVTVPDLRGLDLREASILIVDNGLILGAVTEIYGNKMAPGEVGSQFPVSGSVVRRSEAVDLLVGLGERPLTYKMPSLKNMLLEDGVARLQTLQLSLGRLQYVQELGLPKDMIVAQEPSPGYPVASSAPVSLTVNRQKEVVFFDSGLTFFHYPMGNGFLKTHFKLRLHIYGFLYDLVDTFVKPGNDLWVVVPREPGAVLFVFQGDELTGSHSLSSTRSKKDSIGGWKWELSGDTVGALSRFER